MRKIFGSLAAIATVALCVVMLSGKSDAGTIKTAPSQFASGTCGASRLGNIVYNQRGATDAGGPAATQLCVCTLGNGDGGYLWCSIPTSQGETPTCEGATATTCPK